MATDKMKIMKRRTYTPFKKTVYIAKILNWNAPVYQQLIVGCCEKLRRSFKNSLCSCRKKKKGGFS